MTNRIKIAGLLFVVVLVLATCTYRAMDPNICFTNDVLPIFVSNCGGCHGEYTNYDGIANGVVKRHPKRSKIYKAITGIEPEMPPDGHRKLTDKEVYIIRAWISMGAPNSSNCSSCDTTAFKYIADIKPILDTWCVNCHTTGNAGGGYDFSTYSGTSASAGNGTLLGSIKHLSGYSAMPKNASPISTCDITKIQKWVAAGYPNN